jgi:hypothetical protein
VAKKFSLKDNPIFQGLKAPESGASQMSEEDSISSDSQNLTLNNRPSTIDPQNLAPKNNPQVSSSALQSRSATTAHEATHIAQNKRLTSNKLSQSSETYEQNTQADLMRGDKTTPVSFKIEKQSEPSKSRPSNIAPLSRNANTDTESATQHVHLDLRENLDKSLFFGFYNEVSDVLLPTLELNAQVLYNRLFRLSYGFNRNYCTVSQPLLMQRTGLSRNTVRTGLQSLVKKGWIRIIESGNRVSTTYRIFLPREHRQKLSQNESDDLEPPGESILDPQNLTLKYESSNYYPSEDQNSALQKIPLNEQNLSKSKFNNNTPSRPSKFDPQNLTPLLLLTNRSFTQHEGELDPQNLTSTSRLLTAHKLVEKFYAHLGNRVSKMKREQSLKTCIKLLEEGFLPEEIDYTISWLLERHPDTGTFNRIAHFIDQALRDWEKAKETSMLAQQNSEEEQREALEQKQNEAKQKRIEKIKETLSEKELNELKREAIKRVEEEHGRVLHGRAILVRLKVDDLIQQRYLDV